jgi:hypothetical protein
MGSYEVVVPITVTVEEEAGGLKPSGFTLEGWGGFFSEAEEACGVWDVDHEGWGCEAQEEIAEVARSFVQRLLRTGDTTAPVGHDD